MSQPAQKRDFLAAAGALNQTPEQVRAPLFERHRFFDPRDKAQVKYEMLRAHGVDGQTVKAASEAFGYSRQTFYTALETFEALGVLGLTDSKRGRRSRLKLTEEDVGWIERLAREDPELSGRLIAERLLEERDVEVHQRTVERILAASGKKNR